MRISETIYLLSSILVENGDLTCFVKHKGASYCPLEPFHIVTVTKGASSNHEDGTYFYLGLRDENK